MSITNEITLNRRDWDFSLYVALYMTRSKKEFYFQKNHISLSSF